MKKLVSIMAATAVFFSASAFAEEIKVYINSQPVNYDQPPVIYNDYTYVPFRAIFEDFGMVVQWHDNEKRATAFNNTYNVSFIMDYNYIFINDIGHPIPSGPIIYNSRMLIPLRALVEAIDGQIYWDEASRSVNIYSDQVVDDTCWPQEVLRLTNNIRAEYGLGMLSWSDSLAEVGREHCIDMAARGYFDHTSPDGLSPFDRMHKKGIWFTYAGENIAAGQVDPEAVVEAWMNSPEHKENILTPEFTYMGACMYRGGDYGIYWGQEFAG